MSNYKTFNMSEIMRSTIVFPTDKHLIETAEYLEQRSDPDYDWTCSDFKILWSLMKIGGIDFNRVIFKGNLTSFNALQKAFDNTEFITHVLGAVVLTKP